MHWNIYAVNQKLIRIPSAWILFSVCDHSIMALFVILNLFFSVLISINDPILSINSSLGNYFLKYYNQNLLCQTWRTYIFIWKTATLETLLLFLNNETKFWNQISIHRQPPQSQMLMWHYYIRYGSFFIIAGVRHFILFGNLWCQWTKLNFCTSAHTFAHEQRIN